MSSRGYYFLPIWMLITVSFCLDLSAQGPSKEDITISHQQWDNLLDQYVDGQGNVNYRAFNKDTETLEGYLEYLGSFEPTDEWPRSELLAFYINLYNAATVRLILEHYPIASIREIKQPWVRKWIPVGKKTRSLNQIEHKILRNMSEPRIHFAISCASASCPKLSNTAFDAENLEAQLEKVTWEFINDPGKNEIDSGRITLSALFKWYKNDFTQDRSITDYIGQYSKQSILTNAKVQYLKYDWSLNEQ
ncbi:MAG: DUF547 domain-containing protein [Eudoraea sp.]|nr:DUF547 domain-containing protein [Eudoraea sp.]